MSEATSEGPGPDVEVIDLTGLSDSSEEEEDQDEEGENEDEERSEGDGSDTGLSSEVEVLVNETSRARLHDAIATVSEERLRRLVSSMVDVIPDVEEMLTRELITLKRKTRDMVPRWEMCCQCDEEFDMAERREDEECAFHPGELEVDEEGFPDHDEDCHGPMDTPENRRNFPENFTWTCCGWTSSSEGCVHGVHKAAVARKKRRI
ncbi:hypothetical protein Hypma_006398 [Hypsizygus marmoreus]|uniref:C2H2-type domain-containing protein n=1 Tax=Hypsizygus marmoreus TaxID=39966 RepID=A0A369K2L7_HYPMA|nr:hypothetical protein Hypma_006398 [Hypsizygus marmoreus]